MRVALGWKAHSGWAALVCIGVDADAVQVLDRRRVELIEDGALWAKQPYHSAEFLVRDEARELVKRGTESARRVAARAMQEAVARSRSSKHEIVACAVLTPDPMPQWSTDEILAVHFRMHKAEGVLFPDVLCRAAETCRLTLVAVPEKQLEALAVKALRTPLAKVMETVATLGKTVGAPWGKDQKTATVAALIALRARLA
jgi:hypothetical protein